MPNMITITDAAAEYIKSIIEKSADENYQGLKIAIKKGGCSGSEYDFQYAKEKGKYDEVITEKGVTLFIDPTAQLKIIGSQLDFKKDQFSAQLVFENPNELGKCGCGQSVQL